MGWWLLNSLHAGPETGSHLDDFILEEFIWKQSTYTVNISMYKNKCAKYKPVGGGGQVTVLGTCIKADIWFHYEEFS